MTLVTSKISCCLCSIGTDITSPERLMFQSIPLSAFDNCIPLIEERKKAKSDMRTNPKE